MSSRNAYMLTTNVNSQRTIFSKDILKKIGFNVILVPHIPHRNKIFSNKISMISIYQRILDHDENEYAYVFENDINILNDITLDEIISYEKISEYMFYLGLCKYNREKGVTMNNHLLNGVDVNVYSVNGNVRGLHAIGISKKGAKELIEFAKKSKIMYMDVVLEGFTRLHPANVVRYDLESYIRGHKGVIFQDRLRFPSEI